MKLGQKVFIAVQILVIGLTPHARASQLSRCQAFLVGAKANVLRQLNDPAEALRELSQFRAQHLRRFDYHPDNKTVQAHSGAEQAELEKITARISGVLKDGRERLNLSEDQTSLRSTVFGSVLKNDEIAVELEARQKIRRLEVQLKAPRVFKLYTGLVGGLNLFAAAGLSAAALESPHASTLAVCAALAIFLRSAPERFFRLLKLWDYGMSDEALMQKALREMRDGQWSYRSYDIPVPFRVLQKLFSGEELVDEDFSEFAQNFSAARSTVALTGANFADPFVFSASTDSAWLRLDELLTKDAKSHELKLVTVIRTSESLPKFTPTPKKQRELEQTFYQHTLEPVPIRVPVRTPRPRGPGSAE